MESRRLRGVWFPTVAQIATQHGQWESEWSRAALCAEAGGVGGGGTPVVFKQSIFLKRLSLVIVSPTNSAWFLTAVFVLWIFLHSIPSPFPFLPASLSRSAPLPSVVLTPITFCKHFIREPLVFSKAPRQTDRAAVNRTGNPVESFPRNKLSAAPL